MRYSIDIKSTKKAYMQLYEQLRTDIINSLYKFGDKLPSKRILAEETQTSVITVEHAYAILCEEGYIESKERSGYFVADISSIFTENRTCITTIKRQEKEGNRYKDRKLKLLNIILPIIMILSIDIYIFFSYFYGNLTYFFRNLIILSEKP